MQHQYQIGDRVRVIEDFTAEGINAGPGWDRSTKDFQGKEVTINEHSYHEGNEWYGIDEDEHDDGGNWWDVTWFQGLIEDEQQAHISNRG